MSQICGPVFSCLGFLYRCYKGVFQSTATEWMLCYPVHDHCYSLYIYTFNSYTNLLKDSLFQSFQNQGCWVMKGAASDMSGDDSFRVDPKHPRQWFMDAAEANLSPNKKQAVEVPNSLLSGMLHSSASTWGTASNFNSFSGNSIEKLYESEASMRTVDFADRNIESNDLDRFSSERKDDSDPFGIDYSFGLSMSYALDGSRSNVNYGGIRKVKVNQVKESENFVSFPVGHVFDKGVNSIMPISTTHLYDRADGISLSTILNCDKGDENTGEICDRSDVNLYTVGQTYIKGDENLSTESYKQFDCTASTCHVFGEQDNNVISSAHTYNKVKEYSLSAVPFCNKAEDNILSINQNYLRSENSITSICPSYSKGEGTIISFGGSDDDDIGPLGRLVSGYELLMAQSTIRKSDMVNVDLVRSKTESLLSEAPVMGTDFLYKKQEKMSKKLPSNNFPSNVRSLLSTGILDGVPVKYVAWSRQKELRGVIRGSGYSCGCQSCNFSKVINAYEFERHAGCKTKHPNNHIYFENGKTVYGIVQELRSTPQGLLFELMPTITGSPINQKSFRIWKESFLAATRELQRIYGNDEGKQLL